MCFFLQKIREQREEKEELARRVASLEMASLEVLIMTMVVDLMTDNEAWPMPW